PQPTRQQLDDLDALLQRMLALPSGPPEGPADRRADAAPPAPQPPAGNMVLSDPLAPAPSPPAPVSWSAPPEPVPLPLLNPVPPAQRRAPVLPPPAPALSPRQGLIASRPPAPPLLLRPILWLNRGFDGLSFAFGAPGRWLRRPAGRTVLGTVGLALLAAAAALVLLDRFGWT